MLHLLAVLLLPSYATADCSLACKLFPERAERLGHKCTLCDVEAEKISGNNIETTNAVVTCPQSAGTSETVESLSDGGVVELAKSSSTMGCSLWRVSTKGKVPVARSYNGYDWEPYSGDFASTSFTCNDSTCVSSPLPIVPVQRQGGSIEYKVVSYQHSISEENEIARFLEQTTFGPTLDEIKDFPANPATWLQNQQSLPMTSHRQYFRQRANYRFENPSSQGVPTKPCEAGTHYRRYSFTDKDSFRFVYLYTLPRLFMRDRKAFIMEDQVRTVVRARRLYGLHPSHPDSIVLEDGP